MIHKNSDAAASVAREHGVTILGSEKVGSQEDNKDNSETLF